MKTAITPMLAPEDTVEELELCISCLQGNKPGIHFCPHCGTPLTSYAATAPFESMFAEGDFWRKAVCQSKSSPFVRTVILLSVLFFLFSILSGFIVPR